MPTPVPEIRLIPSTTVLFVTRTGSNGTDLTEAATEGFAALHRLMKEKNLYPAAGACVGICPDDPSSTPAEEVRYLSGYVIEDPAALAGLELGEADVTRLEEGRYAVFTHTGPYSTLHKTWRAAYGEWLPSSGEELRNVPPFELYVDDPRTTPEESLRTEICVPIL